MESPVGKLDESDPRAKLSGRICRISGNPLETLNFLPVQTTKMNGLACINPETALSPLSLFQGSAMTNS
jgi:hypothetical protein